MQVTTAPDGRLSRWPSDNQWRLIVRPPFTLIGAFAAAELFRWPYDLRRTLSCSHLTWKCTQMKVGRLALCALAAACMVATGGPLRDWCSDAMDASYRPKDPGMRPSTVLWLLVWAHVIAWGVFVRPGWERRAVATAAAIGVTAWTCFADAAILFSNDDRLFATIAGLACLLTIGVLLRLYCLQVGWQLTEPTPDAVLRERRLTNRSRRTG